MTWAKGLFSPGIYQGDGLPCALRQDRPNEGSSEITAPASQIIEIPLTRSLVLEGVETPRMRPVILAEPGAEVGGGRPVARDRRHPWVTLVAPQRGRIREIVRGPRRSLARVEIEPLAEAAAPSGPQILADKPAAARMQLVEAGFWAGLRCRPGDGAPDPAHAPARLIVVARLSDPAAPAVAEFLGAEDRGLLETGVSTLSELAGAPATLVHDGPDPLGGALAAVKRRSLPRGGTMRGLGAIVAREGGASADAPVWIADWQEALALGRWLATGHFDGRRIWTLLSEEDDRPRLIRAVIGTPVGAVLEALSLEGRPCLAGAPLLGRAVESLPRRADRLTLVREVPVPRRPRWTGPVLPIRRLESTLPWHEAPAALLRALAAGDDARAEALGAGALAPEDVAAAAFLCPGGHDYPQLLSAFLDRLDEAMA